MDETALEGGVETGGALVLPLFGCRRRRCTPHSPVQVLATAPDTPPASRARTCVPTLVGRSTVAGAGEGEGGEAEIPAVVADEEGKGEEEEGEGARSDEGDMPAARNPEGRVRSRASAEFRGMGERRRCE